MFSSAWWAIVVPPLGLSTIAGRRQVDQWLGLTSCSRPAAASAAPGARRTGRMTELARPQTGVEPGDEAHDVEHRQTEVLPQRPRVGRHVGAFEQDGADL